MPLCLLRMIRVCPTGSVERALQPKIESPPQTPKMCVCIEGRTVVLSGPLSSRRASNNTERLFCIKMWYEKSPADATILFRIVTNPTGI